MISFSCLFSYVKPVYNFLHDKESIKDLFFIHHIIYKKIFWKEENISVSLLQQYIRQFCGTNFHCFSKNIFAKVGAFCVSC